MSARTTKALMGASLQGRLDAFGRRDTPGPMAESSSTIPAPGAQGVLYLIDISGYVFRAFYALPPLTNTKGEATGALYGVTSMIIKLAREKKPHRLAIVMDGKGHSFRKELYADYKANRPSAPDGLKAQMARVREVADAFGLPCYEQEGVEADDLIATLTRVARERGQQVVIVSADKDLLALVGDGVWMLDTMKDKVYGPAETEEKLGVTPAQVRDYLALTGDSSDNVPGVPSVGPKTATELLKQYGTLDDIYAGLGELKKKALKQKLEDNKALAYLSRDLVTLKDDMPVQFDEEALVFSGFDDTALRAFLSASGFTRLLEQLDGPMGLGSAPGAGKATPGGAKKPSLTPPPPSAPVQRPTYTERALRVVTTRAELADAAKAMRSAGKFALFCAAERDEPIAGALVSLSLAWEHDAICVPVGHHYLGVPEQLSIADVRAELAELFADASVAKISSNLKRDAIALAHHGMTLNGVVFDTMLASYLLDPDLRGHGLSEIILRHNDRTIANHESVVGKGKAQKLLSELTFQEALPWCSNEATLTEPVAQELSRELQEAKLGRLLVDVEIPLASVLASMEIRGVKVDPEKLRTLSLEADKQMSAFEKRCYELAGKEFNVNSPRQLETILFDELHLPVVERTKTARSTNADVLEELAAMHELPAAILEHRQLSKLKGTYLDALPREINPRTGRIHTKFEQAVAATGRLSSNDPNLQNIPIRTEIGRAIREAFVAEEGYSIFAADYSQIELRVLAHLSGDAVLSDAFSRHADVHVGTAQALFGVQAAEVTRDQRAAAKTVNFAVIYGQTQFALARNLRISKTEAARYIKAFFERYHGVRVYLDQLVQEARETGAVRTIMGRRRLVKDILAKNQAVRGGAERIAQNMPIQGSAADIMKTAMVRVHKAMSERQMKSRMVLTVHDELVFEAHDSEREELEALVREGMEGAIKLNVPLVVDTGWGTTWGKAH
jgi:DNA polymerase-1